MTKEEYIKIIIQETLSEFNHTLDEDELSAVSANISSALSVYNEPQVDIVESKQKDDKDKTIEVLNDFINAFGRKFGIVDL